MTELRQRMGEDMQVRKDIRIYLVYLTNEKKLAPGSTSSDTERRLHAGDSGGYCKVNA